jgi:hypothetical protein
MPGRKTGSTTHISVPSRIWTNLLPGLLEAKGSRFQRVVLPSRYKELVSTSERRRTSPNS